MSSSTDKRVILVTGANKGIGFELVKKLSNNKDVIVLLATRDFKQGEHAAKKLGDCSNIHLLQLDTSSSQSIHQAAEQIRDAYGYLDVLINNAGIAKPDYNLQAARTTFATNYFGIKTLNRYLIPLMRPNGRIINVSSVIGLWTLDGCSDELKSKWLNPNLTESELDKLIDQFFASIERLTEELDGYPTQYSFLIYGMSKAALNMLTRIQANNLTNGILIHAVCPGYSDASLNQDLANEHSPSLGADSILYVVDHIENENGKLWQDGKKVEWTAPCKDDFLEFMKNMQAIQY
ncbi:unnamed protein product [Didymodactylos carnosus]|nr:unnamed protein product [Didymodactylos carnosus]CAF3820890.1 unnamed protein product [Didymodactylos carnosus]